MARWHKPHRVFLVGPMGAGKSTVGRELAALLGLEFVDADTEIERRTGASIPWIFDLEGESGFRAREAALIDELSQRDGLVLATGGGAITTPANRDALGARGVVVYLHAPVEVQLQRTRHDTSRPLLQGDDPRGRLEGLMGEREPLYREVADIVVEAGQGRARALAKRIVRALEGAAAE
ncbi:shikimate kinase AroK [Halorhodospira neutriphila]|uniref:Shikimate kinase n=1 Tax=Halorhodospira neutriphila TaxID=168379 RepID=A0ABS1E753_9GAMM|nr:shikimate kinase AroK [Halorhodospira neutriphila]MBK1727561.1 shikimate kinase I [Halorhodospira neutriphila]